MPTDSHTLQTPDGPMDVYEARPDDGGRAAVIVVQEAFGVNDHIQDVTRRFADAGYHAVAPAFFHRSGGGTAPYGDFSKVLPLYAGLDDPGIERDIEATIGLLSQSGWAPGEIGIVGFCFGGRVTFLAAARFALGGAVGFYGGGIVTARFPQFPPLVDRAGALQTPWLGLFGDRDESIPVEDVERIRTELKSAPVRTDVVRYPDAGHGFHCDQRPDGYNEEAAKDGWARTLEWLVPIRRSA
jgi:carboxymethylenebutenolidase